MPAPYSDNPYSDPDPDQVSPHGQQDADGADAADDVDAQALSPSDGYFHATGSQDSIPAVSSQPQQRHQSSTVPYVPNVLVEDPTLRDKDGSQSKATEAERERLLNTSSDPHPASSHQPFAPSPSTSAATSATPQTAVSYPQLPQPSSVPSHQHRRSVEEDPASLFVPAESSAPSSGPYNSQFATSSRRPRVGYPGQSDAPPAYTPTSPDASQPNYSTFPSSAAPTPSSPTPMGAPEEQQHLLGGSPGPAKQPVWKRIRDSHDSGYLRKKIKTILGVLVVLSILFIIFGSVSVDMSSGHRKRIVDDEPVRDPVVDHGDMIWEPPKSSECFNNPYKWNKKTFTTHFSSDRFLAIHQEISKQLKPIPDGTSPQVFGNVVIRPSEKSSGDGSIDVEIITSDDSVYIDVDFDEHDRNQILNITTPRSVEGWAHKNRPCIQVRATAWVPQKAILNGFEASTVQLNVGLSEGLILGVEDTFKVETVSGSVRTAGVGEDSEVNPYNVEAPCMSLSSVSGSVKGWFPLYDNLKIETVSGSITADVGLKETNLKRDGFPLLEIESISGTVRVDENLKHILDAEDPAKVLPIRDYMNKIETASGSITANLVTASKSSIETISGTLKLQFLPLLDKQWADADWKPSIATSSTSGTVNYTLLEPIYADLSSVSDPESRFPPKKPKDGKDKDKNKDKNKDVGDIIIKEEDEEEWSSLKAKRSWVTASRKEERANGNALSFLKTNHESISGTMRLRYPASWEGSFKASAMSSTIKVRGKDVEVHKRSGFMNKVVEGKKGDGQSYINIDEMSGTIDLLIGEE